MGVFTAWPHHGQMHCPPRSCHCPSETCRSPRRREPGGLHWRSRCRLDISACFSERKYGLSIVRSHRYVSRFHHPAGWEEVIWRVVSRAPLQTQGWLSAVTRGGGVGGMPSLQLQVCLDSHICAQACTGGVCFLGRWVRTGLCPRSHSLACGLVLACAGLLASGDLMVYVMHVCTCLLWQGGSYHGISALKIKNTLEVSETYLGVVVQSLSCV